MLLSDILLLKLMQWQIAITHNQCVDVFKSLVLTSQKQEAANIQRFVQTFVHFWFGLSFPLNLHFLCNKTAYLLPTVCVFLRVSTCWMRTGWFKKNKKEKCEFFFKKNPSFPPSLFWPMQVFTWETREQRKPLKREASWRGRRHWWGQRGGDSCERRSGWKRGVAKGERET